LPETAKGPKFFFGNRFDGIAFDHPKFMSRRKLITKEFNQPEYLDPPSYMGHSPGVKMSPKMQKKNDKKAADNVGPGRYSPNLTNYSPKFSIPMANSTSSGALNQLPGPGEYCPEAAINYLFPALGKTISVVVPECKQAAGADTPGPGTYEPKLLDKVTSLKYFYFALIKIG